MIIQHKDLISVYKFKNLHTRIFVIFASYPNHKASSSLLSGGERSGQKKVTMLLTIWFLFALCHNSLHSTVGGSQHPKVEYQYDSAIILLSFFWVFNSSQVPFHRLPPGWPSLVINQTQHIESYFPEASTAGRESLNGRSQDPCPTSGFFHRSCLVGCLTISLLLFSSYEAKFNLMTKYLIQC